MSPLESEMLEMRLIADAIWEKFGYDFRSYAPASFKRRLKKASEKYDLVDAAALLHKILTEPDFFTQLINDLTVTVTEFFRDPAVYRAFRERVVPHLQAYPEIKVWCAGCAGGEEVYSVAILLKEEGLLERSLIYGTDINPLALKRAADGIYPLEAVQLGTSNYFAGGGRRQLAEYYRANYGAARMDPSFRRHIVFSDHNLVTDKQFGEMQLVFCRNVLIYFDKKLQDQTLTLLRQSLCRRGFLCIGTKESLRFSPENAVFEAVAEMERIYRRVD